MLRPRVFSKMLNENVEEKTIPDFAPQPHHFLFTSESVGEGHPGFYRLD